MKLKHNGREIVALNSLTTCGQPPCGVCVLIQSCGKYKHEKLFNLKPTVCLVEGDRGVYEKKPESGI